jgi:hypothetical protein
MVITIDGAAVKIDGAKPVPYRDISEVNDLIAGLHLATAPELLGSPTCKACPGAKVYAYATNAVAYRRTGTSVIVLVNLCPEHIRIERVHADMFGWALHVLPEPLSLTGQYLFDCDKAGDSALLGERLAAHRDVLTVLTGNDHAGEDPAAAAGNAGYPGTEQPVVLSSPPETGGNLPASPKAPRRNAGAARPREGGTR